MDELKEIDETKLNRSYAYKYIALSSLIFFTLFLIPSIFAEGVIYSGKILLSAVFAFLLLSIYLLIKNNHIICYTCFSISCLSLFGNITIYLEEKYINIYVICFTLFQIFIFFKCAKAVKLIKNIEKHKKEEQIEENAKIVPIIIHKTENHYLAKSPCFPKISAKGNKIQTVINDLESQMKISDMRVSAEQLYTNDSDTFIKYIKIYK